MMKDKKLILIAIALTVSLALNAGFAVFLARETRTTNDGKKAEVLQKIVDREIVESDYFMFITDPDLIAKIEKYNLETGQHTSAMQSRITRMMNECFGFKITQYNYYEQPPEIRNIVTKTYKYALYRNSQEFINNDSDLAQMLLLPPFKNNAKWQSFMRNENLSLVDTDYFTEYYDLVDDLAQSFELDKSAIVEKIFAREIIADTYLAYLDGALLKDALEYNELTAVYRQYFTGHAILTFQSLCNFENAPSYLGRPISMSEFVSRTARHALHKNAEELIYGDAFISALRSFEAGGSYGAWPGFIHAFEDEHGANSLENYFTLADRLARACLDN